MNTKEENTLLHKFFTEHNEIVDDHEFDNIYPHSIKILSDVHWTPLEVALKASELLVKTPETKVLDIGSGSGKFCLIGASYTEGLFTGIEQRKFLVDISKKMSEEYNIKNADFIHANILHIDFSEYDAFYFFNSFEENVFDIWPRIDYAVELSVSKYDEYNAYIFEQFEKLASGTRIVTYCSSDKQIPDSYDLEESCFDNLMRLWVKK